MSYYPNLIQPSKSSGPLLTLILSQAEQVRATSSASTSPLQSPWYDPELGLLSVSLRVHVCKSVRPQILPSNGLASHSGCVLVSCPAFPEQASDQPQPLYLLVKEWPQIEEETDSFKPSVQFLRVTQRSNFNLTISISLYTSSHDHNDQAHRGPISIRNIRTSRIYAVKSFVFIVFTWLNFLLYQPCLK